MRSSTSSEIIASNVFQKPSNLKDLNCHFVCIPLAAREETVLAFKVLKTAELADLCSRHIETT